MKNRKGQLELFAEASGLGKAEVHQTEAGEKCTLYSFDPEGISVNRKEPGTWRFICSFESKVTGREDY